MLKAAEVADLIEEQVAPYEASLVRRNGVSMDVDVRLRRADGYVCDYKLTLAVSGEQVSAKERRPIRMPASCPERHINKDGTFCLTWQRGKPLLVRNAEEAQAWWATLLQFLRKQEIAAHRMRWPGKAWAHGDAAHYQHEAEESAAALGPRYLSALETGRLNVRTKRGTSGTFLELRDGERWLYAVWEKFKRVATLKQRCLCGRSVQLRACGAHARNAADLVLALVGWRRAERAFWKDYEGAPCCGTMKDCPLRLSSEATSANDSNPIEDAA